MWWKMKVYLLGQFWGRGGNCYFSPQRPAGEDSQWGSPRTVPCTVAGGNGSPTAPVAQSLSSPRVSSSFPEAGSSFPHGSHPCGGGRRRQHPLTPTRRSPAEEALGSVGLLARLAQCSHGWRLLWSSPSGLEEETSLPQSTPARTKFPVSSSAVPQNKGRGRCEVSQELKGKARSWNWKPRAIQRLTLLAGDQWEPWQEHTGEPLPATRRLLTPMLLLGWAAASPATGQRGY